MNYFNLGGDKVNLAITPKLWHLGMGNITRKIFIIFYGFQKARNIQVD